MSKSSKSERPRKPYPDFPLFPHATRRWAKKILGKLFYFGPWENPDAALKRYVEQRDDLQAGRTPRVQKDGLKLMDLVNRFLTSKRMMVGAGELSSRSLRDYYVTCERLLGTFGKSRLVIDLDADDFEKLKTKLTKTGSPITVGNEVTRVRVVFNWAFEQGLIDKPLRYGAVFKKPSKKTVRLERAKKGPRMFEADQLRKIIDVAPMPMKAMIMLGINGGLGNTDLANLQIGHLDLEGAWLNYPRPKTGIRRRVPLWEETVALVQEAINIRPTPKREEDADCVFLTLRGERCVRIHESDAISRTVPLDKAGVKVDAITRDFGKLLTSLKLKRPGLNFYALRHTFETIGGDSKDQVAVDAIMGHAEQSISADYRERIDDARLIAVVNVVREWLWPKPKTIRGKTKKAQVTESASPSA